MDPISLLIYFLVAMVILAIIWYAAAAFGIPEPARRIIFLVAVLIVLLWILQRAALI